MSIFDLTGRTAVVTGGANGIGRACARRLSESGAKVWIFDLEPPPESDALFARADVTDRASLESAFSRSGPPDVLIANAGIAVPAAFAETAADLWQRTLAINLTGAFHTLQLGSAFMRQRRSGAIVLTASTNSYDGESDLTAYNASKSGLLGLLHTAANELGPYGVRVNAVCPGLIRTRLTERHFSTPTVLKDYFRHIPLGRGGDADEVANAVAFLASDAASFITGAALFVDGGQMAAKFGTWTDESADFVDGRWILK